MNLAPTFPLPAADADVQPAVEASHSPVAASAAVADLLDLDPINPPIHQSINPARAYSLPTPPLPPPPRPTRNTDPAWRAAEALAAICRQYDELIASGQHSLRTAAAALGKSPSFFSGANAVYTRWQRHGLAGLLAAQRASVGRTMEVPVWFVPAARFFYLLSNHSQNQGSLPEAVRRTISLPAVPFGWTFQLTSRLLVAINSASSSSSSSLPTCPADLREQILARQAAGRELVTERIARQIIVNPNTVQYFRSPRDWALANQSAPGSQRRASNDAGDRRAMAPGDWFGGDDATPGIAVCVPISANEVCTPASEKYGVLLGRFQWLAYIDARTDKLLAHDYVVRPRGSYRAEDILNGMGAVVRTHGIPRRGWQFEGGAWNSKLVCQAIDLLHSEHWRTYSPHQKCIESVFNRVWTRLAVQFPHADMGRYRNENEANCKLYEACKAGHKDPRTYFPTLETVIQAFQEEVAYHNGHRLFSEQYGQWVPDEFFARSVAAEPLRAFSREMEWIFSPYTAERSIRGMTVSCRVPMFENFSIPFEFGSDWMPQYHGKKVRLHFNPRLPKCVAKVILLQTAVDASGRELAPGAILGDAHLIGETASHIRYILEWGDDNQQAAYLQRQKVANFVRRETRGIGIGGRVDYSKSEQRGGIQGAAIVERGQAADQSQLADGVTYSGSGDPAPARSLTPIPKTPGVPNECSARSESPHVDPDACPVPDRAARRANLEALRRETDNLFV